VRALDSNVKWILEVLNDYDQRGYPAMKERIAALTDDEKDSIIRVLLCIQHGQVTTMREAIREELTRQRFEGLGGDPTLN
jgi:hypothetical protein